MNKSFNVLMVVGKTGGHLYPALALAERMKSRIKGVNFLFLTVAGSVSSKILEKEGYNFKEVKAKRFMGASVKEKVEALAVSLLSVFDSIRIIKEFKPNIVIGFGSFLTPPVILAAKLLRIKTAIQEQNSIPGQANRLTGKIADMVFLGFEKARVYFPAKKTYVFGNPIRERICKIRNKRIKDDIFTLLIFGGSQGSRFFNTKLPQIIIRILKHKDMNVIHQTGPKDSAMVEKMYEGYEDRVKVVDYIHDMAEVYKITDFAIARAGASSVFELAILGIPTIFIPFPYATSNHQYYNAKELEKNQACYLITEDEFDENFVIETVIKHIDNPEKSEEIRERLTSMVRPGATDRIIDVILEKLNMREVEG